MHCFILVASVQQLHHAASLGASARSQNAGSEKKHGHGHGHRHNLSECASDLSEACSTPRGNNSSNTHVISFTLYELETITKSFRGDYILGEGGFGTVYKGYIDENVRVGLKSLPVAVKVLNKEGLQGHREWLVRFASSSFLLTWLICLFNFVICVCVCVCADGGEFSRAAKAS